MLFVVFNSFVESKTSFFSSKNVVGKYDIFDTSDTCSVEAQVLFNYNNTDYLLACSSIENVYAYVEGMPISISNALNYNVITKEEILNSTIDLVH